jgi:serine/threonine protein kinase
MSQTKSSLPRRAMRMVPCERCNTQTFIPSDTGMFQYANCKNCGHSVMTPVKLREFELRAVIGSGGMATVFRAHDEILDRDVAVKLMKPEFTENSNAMAGFFREARYQASLNHTHIVQVYNYGEDAGHKFLVMEVADRGDLDALIQKHGRVDELYVLDVGVKISSALELVAKKGMLHLDLKPDNILYNIDGEPKLTDFGIARRTDDGRNPDGLVGTPFYIAPERVALGRQDFRSDMYSLGATLYHALTGRVPFDAPTVEETVWMHVKTRLHPPRKLVSSVSKDTEAAILRSMHKDPEKRYASFEDFRMALEASRSRLLVKRYG